MLRTIKPKNARSKRALKARESKEVEDPRTAIFVRGTNAGEKVQNVMQELMALKRPYAISFSKKNTVRPFEDPASLEFWAQKNDASLFVVGQSNKKRPDGMTFVRMFDNRVLDMLEVGVENFVSMREFKTPKATPGHKPLMHFASELFTTHPRLQQLKSLLLTFFNGEEIDGIHLAGLEHVISVTLGPTPPSLSSTGTATTTLGGPTGDLQPQGEALPKVHIRAYTIRLLASGTKVPRVELTPMGPSLDLTLRRHQDADAEVLKQALRRPKLKKQDVAKGLGKKRKNLEVDEMGDLRGRIHVEKQDLSKLQTRKMKGLKAVRGEAMDVDEESAGDEHTSSERKRRRTD
ncbi:Brix-domain-containing protein [Phanerochaete sordida]|uniref:Ribosome production factor 2 homolog n=1 Tax=Phanerochaete sordida TaxID=48140 RepID=A0A9P3GTB2_9APHY|nr:Brix-domain-containing protein [Phanerochaete sordida]